MEELDCVVVGAGVVGLAVARSLALLGRGVAVLEAADAIGTETSSRNSEVIHAGIYYPQGSLKARLCVSGKKALYAYCAERGIAHRRSGKLIVATSLDQLGALAAIRAGAAANGVRDLEILSAAEAAALEPALRCEGALISPSTGIVDSHALMIALQGDIENAGGFVALNTQVGRARVTGEGFEITTRGSDPTTLRSRALINAAGLSAIAFARCIEGLSPRTVPRAWFAKGSYFALSGPCPFSRLIYPVPEKAGLGVHLTLDLAGRGRFGPDVEWVERPSYDVEVARAALFYEAIRRYWPALPDDALNADYAGVRPKSKPPEEQPQDFDIQGPGQHGVPGLVNLYGIESPGLTAALAIGDFVAGLVER